MDSVVIQFNDIPIGYEVQGEGVPLVFVLGWEPTIASGSIRVPTFINDIG